VQLIKHGDHIVSAVRPGIRAWLVGLVATAVTATIDEDQPAAASLEALDIPGLAPDFAALRETVQQNERDAVSNYVISDLRSVSGQYVHHLVHLRSMSDI
jgi:hypothetical protein